MKKLLLILVLFFVTTSEFSAQRDTDHWFAPMMSRGPANNRQALFFSTDSVTPFPVSIFSNNVVIGTVTISKGSPQFFDVPLNNIITSSQSDLFTVKNLGLYTKADKPYYATLRFSITSHGEILTSKGKAGIGKKFYSVHAPLTTSGSGQNFTLGMLATEDNTTVTVSGYNANVQFSNGTTGATNPVTTFTLMKGQSYIMEGRTNILANRDGFIGAKIEADKNISVTNGNFDGQFAITSSFDGEDIVMDQSVPTDRLGDEFVMVKGFGNIDEGMEGAVIVGTESGTQIFLNGAALPVATINEGQYYRVTSAPYINQGSGHYNMHIRTSKNVYVYQLLAGVATSNATIGFNYIPPLNCFLPRKIDEIGLINQLPYYTTLNPTIKLNILTEVGAAVTVNGVVPTAAQGPFPVTGSTNWVSYSLPSVTGNITVNSTKAVTAGIAGGSGVVGYGGYFAGFSSIPLISKQTGDCIPGLVLEVDDSYDTYQWNLNGVAIPGATNNSYTPLVGGNFTCTVTVGSCAPAITPVFKVFTCLATSTQNLVACAPLAIFPAFTNSTQIPVPSTVTIVTPPANGIASIDSGTGVITYTPNPGFIGNDSMVFSFCGDAAEFIDCEQVTVNFDVPTYPDVINVTLTECFIAANPTTATFDLTSAVVTTTAGATFQYYPGLADAQNGTNEILNPTNYTVPSSLVYVKVTNNGGCFKIAKITLVVTPQRFSTTLPDQYICIENTTTLDAGGGFDSYLWSTGETTATISNVSVGEYWVDLGINNCITRQKVKVFKVPDLLVNNVEISNNSATITAIGGNPPYQYSLDNSTFQNSNVFTNLPRGSNIFYIKDSFNCLPVILELTIPNLINAITPNGDNINDFVDYSELAYKKNLIVDIYDRYGNKIFQANKDNGYKWDGKVNDRKVSTGNYWYSITWNELDVNGTPVAYSGWIMVKNTNY
ncbi:T9SS type B sorting domain-containing protein [Frigoriflavimonas asaccharolytica]|uniref:Gliding motility-associated-like protein n=1 Tax=Frigoriflavimonas asaccharolytica TaxID=2735899 RepID=A0A8J8GCC9_9FLAO|nr:T9SS type B sorting domain-containing protein [Frigoriflavimonas asaccharolytica]NRS93629.1 gliding motility-associated-like protein [Frigoriflavimonas asaccharolytica]